MAGPLLFPVAILAGMVAFLSREKRPSQAQLSRTTYVRDGIRRFAPEIATAISAYAAARAIEPVELPPDVHALAFRLTDFQEGEQGITGRDAISEMFAQGFAVLGTLSLAEDPKEGKLFFVKQENIGFASEGSELAVLFDHASVMPAGADEHVIPDLGAQVATNLATAAANNEPPVEEVPSNVIEVLDGAQRVKSKRSRGSEKVSPARNHADPVIESGPHPPTDTNAATDPERSHAGSSTHANGAATAAVAMPETPVQAANE